MAIPVFVNTNTAVRQAGGAFSSAMTVSATGPNHCARVDVSFDLANGLSISAITLGGVAMTAFAAHVQSAVNAGNYTYVQSFYLMNPPSGSQTLVITVTGANEIYANLSVYSDVDAVTPAINFVTSNPGGTSTTGGVTVTSATNQLSCSVASVVGGFTFTGTNQTSQGIEVSGTLTFGSDRCTTPAASVTHTWTADGAGNFAVLGFSLQGIQTELEGFRFRNDDGSETTATWKAAQDTNVTSPSGANTRLRTLINTPSDPPSTAFAFEYKLSSDTLYRLLEVAGGGAVAFGTAGAVSSGGTTSISVAYPASIAKGDLLLLFVANRPNANTPDNISGWTRVTQTGGAGSEGAGTGTVRLTLYCKVDADGRPGADGTETGNQTVTCTSGTSMFGRMFRYTKTTGKVWSVATAVGADNSAGTSYSAAAGSDPGVTAADMVVVGVANSEDTARAASEALSQSGITFGTMTEQQDSGITTGNDLGLVVADFEVTSGTSAGNPTFTATFSGTNAANSAGPAIFVRIRQVDQPIQLSASANITAGGESTTPQLVPPATKSTSDHVTGRMWDDENGLDSLNITSAGYMELECCAKAISAQVSNGQVYQLRVKDLTTYTFTPEWTIGTGLTHYTLDCVSAAFATTGTAATLKSARFVAANSAGFTVTGTDAGVRATRTIAANSAAFTATGTATTLLKTNILSAGSASFTVTGTDVSLLKTVPLVAGSAAYAVSGQDVTFRRTYVLACASAAFTVTGTAASLLSTRRLSVDSAAFTVTGTSANLDYSGSGSKILSADSASFAFTGTATTLRATRRVSVDAGAWTVTGADAGLRPARTIAANAGAFTATGTSAGLTAQRRITSNAGAFTVTGTDANVRATRRLTSSSAAYAATGNDAGLRSTRQLSCSNAGFTVTGTNAAVTRTRAVLAESAAFIVTGSAASLYSVLIQAVGVVSPRLNTPRTANASMGVPGTTAASMSTPDVDVASIITSGTT